MDSRVRATGAERYWRTMTVVEAVFSRVAVQMPAQVPEGPRPAHLPAP